ncbi:MAG: hypothetical protein JW991_05070 [Candidatus Pacebacteria bacterium]|nr:hypothetical protein [Candidatus Paceibacterota bacterium]
MSLVVFFAPHPPILLPQTGAPFDRAKVKKTTAALEKMGQEIARIKPEIIIISSPHPDWGFEVPWYFVKKSGFENQSSKVILKNQRRQTPANFRIEPETPTVYPILTTPDSIQQHYQWGQEIAARINLEKKWLWLASGDMSHRLKEDGPYGLHPSGKKFDRAFLNLLKEKAVEKILELDPLLIEEAGECGLRSFCLALGALEAGGENWQPQILSYEAPFGVGYLVARLGPA